ncbi:MAG: hypothetical protein IPF54_26885 [Draconibacterium sp.]|nr:hypothetical protein [Draconibacterium sp.]
MYDSFTGYAELSSASDNILFDEKFIAVLTKEKFVELSDKVEELQNAGTLCGHPHNHPLAQIATKIYNPQNRTTAHELISKYIEILNQKLQNQKQLCELLLIDETKFDKEKTDSLEKLCAEIKSLPDTPATLINIERPERNLTQIIELTKHGEKRDNYRDTILNDFNKGILKYDAEQNLTTWNTVSQKLFLPKLLGQNKILKTLRPLSKTGKVEKVKSLNILKL